MTLTIACMHFYFDEITMNAILPFDFFFRRSATIAAPLHSSLPMFGFFSLLLAALFALRFFPAPSTRAIYFLLSRFRARHRTLLRPNRRSLVSRCSSYCTIKHKPENLSEPRAAECTHCAVLCCAPYVILSLRLRLKQLHHIHVHVFKYYFITLSSPLFFQFRYFKLSAIGWKYV